MELDEFYRIVSHYCDAVEAGLTERWKKLPVELYKAETYEVIGALLSRQAALTIQLARSPGIWNVHMAPMVLRAMTDCHITLAWILKEPDERSRRYILYGLGQEKLAIETYKAEADMDDVRVQQLVAAKESWLGSQRRDFLTEVNVGSWSGSSTRQMAEEADLLNFYKFAYTPFSGAVHNMWQHVSLYNLKTCTNPLHKFHKVPEIFGNHIEPDFLFRSAKYTSMSYSVVDDVYSLDIEAPLPIDEFVRLFSDPADDNAGEADGTDRE
jgi:hypothetical protein